MSASAHSRAVLSLLPALLALSACGTTSSSTGDPFGGPAGRNEVRILVQNTNFYDARIYAIVDGLRRHLGTVGGKTDGVFTMPLAFSQDIRLQIDMLAGSDCTTDVIPVDPGDTLQLQILPNPLASELCR
jgi:hypothetical protein